MSTLDTLISALTLGVIGYFGLQYLNSGVLNKPTGILPTEPAPLLDDDMFEEGLIEKKEVEGKKKGKKKDRDRDRDNEGYFDQPPQGPMGPPTQDIYGNPYGQNQLGYPVNRNVLAPPPGAISSLYPMQVPMTPPYVSQTVNTYSQYSPYNQFSQYQQYQTPQTGYMQTTPDDNIGFTDIDTNRYGCATCKSRCQQSPYGYSCRICRAGCKRITHYYQPPQTGWTIGPAGGGLGGPSTYSFLGQLYDTLTGGATFAEMDDYSQKRRFDCHNKLKRRVKGKDNSFVSQDDYYYDRNNISIANL
jgi:hypothetical protein